MYLGATDGKGTAGSAKVFDLTRQPSFVANVSQEFWENRVAATNLRPAQTRIPEVPDQTEFLKRWYEFHRGYRIVTREDGSEERIAVLGEDFKDVSPGHLPRTLDELRAGQERSAADQHQYVVVQEQPVNDGPSLEDTLDQMFDAADAEASNELRSHPIATADPAPTTTVNVAGQVMQGANSRNREYQNRRIASLRRELHRMRHGVERVIAGLRELGESVPDSTEATGRLAQLDRSLDSILGERTAATTRNGQNGQSSVASATTTNAQARNIQGIQQRLEEATARHTEAEQARRDAVAELDEVERHLALARTAREEAVSNLDGADVEFRHSRQQLNQLQRERRTTENYVRLFGTREDIEQQGADYESPIGGLFNRAWERFRMAEQTRQEERTLRQVLEDERQVQQAAHASSSDGRAPAAVPDTDFDTQLSEYYAMLRQQPWIHPTQPPQSTFPSSMLDAVRPTGGATLPTTGALDHPSGETSGIEPGRMTVLDRLLQNTSEPERSTIIRRMVENGTAQALQNSDPYTFLSQLRESQGPTIDFEEDSDDTVSEDGHRGLDVEDDNRPDPKTDEQMTVRMDCKVCYTQLADTACLPCGHLVLCQWCSEQHSPVMEHDRTRPRRPANCPVCRKRIKQKVRIYRA